MALKVVLKPKLKIKSSLAGTDNTGMTVSLPTITPHPTFTFDMFSSQLKPYRTKVIEQLNKTALKKEYVVKLEELLYNKAIIDAETTKCGRNFDLFKNIFMHICRHIIANLKPDNSLKNHQFISGINEGKISIDIAVNMNPQDMFYDRWRVLIEKNIREIDNQTKGPVATTDMFWCGKCHRNKCTYFERQDRSADEPMTVHITCCHCGKKWKQ